MLDIFWYNEAVSCSQTPWRNRFSPNTFDYKLLSWRLRLRERRVSPCKKMPPRFRLTPSDGSCVACGKFMRQRAWLCLQVWWRWLSCASGRNYFDGAAEGCWIAHNRTAGERRTERKIPLNVNYVLLIRFLVPASLSCYAEINRKDSCTFFHRNLWKQMQKKVIKIEKKKKNKSIF